MRNYGHETCPLSAALNLNNEVNNDFIWNHLVKLLMKFIKLVALITICKIKQILPCFLLQTIKQKL